MFQKAHITLLNTACKLAKVPDNKVITCIWCGYQTYEQPKATISHIRNFLF